MRFHESRCGKALIALLLVALLTPLSGWAVETALDRVDINRASAAELATLPGIGEAKARAIVEYRTAEPFETVEDLKKVQGIGDHTFETLRSNIIVGGKSR